MVNNLYSPSAERNYSHILKVVRQYLPATGDVLEIASGSGQHVAALAHDFTTLHWQPSDYESSAIATIRARCQHLPNVYAPMALDCTVAAEWPTSSFAGLICINMVHISPWAACQALFAQGSQCLTTDAVFYLYGPFVRRDVPTAPSNIQFDQYLRVQNSQWGLRQLDDVIALAEGHNLMHVQTIAMPANNCSVIFRKR